ncbi:MAG: hypothetical protein GF317_16995 [Candidatus Lokiarchaeota archaeon]|nr:hypothetical protein [Candidatus Lokiarchaeota archaeon]MBD3201216.1 hypothetical protein [Candidatus Lokiarchaeota archaeon]
MGSGIRKTINPNLWTKSLDIEGSINRGQFHYIKSHKINNDTHDDILVGGRGVNPKAGLKWIESPTNISEKRDPTKWKVYDIDPDLESGHGFTLILT